MLHNQIVGYELRGGVLDELCFFSEGYTSEGK